MSELPTYPTLPIKYSTNAEPYRSNTQIRWHMEANDALRAYLSRAMEYAACKDGCSVWEWDDPMGARINSGPCDCGLDAFRAFLREQGVGDEF